MSQWMHFLSELEALDPAVVVPDPSLVGTNFNTGLLCHYFETIWTTVSEGRTRGWPISRTSLG